MASPPPPFYSKSDSMSRSRTGQNDIKSMANAMLDASLSKEKHPDYHHGYHHSYHRHSHRTSAEKQKFGSVSSTASTVVSTRSYTRERLREVESQRDKLLRMVEEERTNAAEMQHLARRERALVERLKREGANASGDGLSEAEIRSRHKQLKRDTRTAHAELSREPTAGLFKTVCSTDLLFLIDTTGSMDPYINAAKQQVLNIVSDVKRYFLGEAEVRVAVVSYKDHDQYPNVQYLDFTSEIDDVRSCLGDLVATGGNDAPEDVLGGIRQALDLSWKQQTRCIIHIADEPPHGRTLHDYINWGDSYPEPGSEPHGLTYKPLLEEMIALNINYALLRIGEATDRMAFEFWRMYAAASADGMIHQFNKYYDRAYNESVGIQFGSLYGGYSQRSTKSGLLFKEAELGTKFDVLRHLIVTIVTDSASRTAVRTSERRSGRSWASKKLDKGDLFTINENGGSADQFQLERSHPQWDVPGWLDEKRMVEGFSLDVVAHGPDTLDSMMEKDENIKMGVTELTIETRSRPFAQGAMRRAFYARTAASTNLYVAKSFIRPGKRLPHLVEDMRCQALSKGFALEFNALVEDHPIDFTVTTCFKSDPITSTSAKTKTATDDYMSLEPYIEGTYVKYNNNCGYITDQNPHDRVNIAAQAFSHFTFERSQGRFLVCDLQGVGYQLTDPSIHTLDPKRFKLSDTNLGREGFKFFFASHVCNDICMRLDLKSTASMLSSGDFVFRTDWPHLETTVCCSNKLCGKIVRMSDDTVAHAHPGYYWCKTCAPQLYLFRNRWVCMEPGVQDHEFEVERFFWESQGVRVPRKCPDHRGSSAGGGEKEGEKRDRRAGGAFWKRLGCF